MTGASDHPDHSEAPEHQGQQSTGQEPWRPPHETKSQRAWAPGQLKKQRSVRTMFASVILTFEALVLVFVALTVFNLNRDAPWDWWALGGILALAVIAILTCAVLRRPLGYWIGWGVQAVFLALGGLEPMIFLVSIGFVAAWAYAVIKGKTIDEENARRREAEEQYRRENNA